MGGLDLIIGHLREHNVEANTVEEVTAHVDPNCWGLKDVADQRDQGNLPVCLKLGGVVGSALGDQALLGI